MKRVLLGCLLALALVGIAQAADIEAGKAKASSCKGCHGSNGISKAPINPNLAGQKEAYLTSSLQAYKSGERKHSMMTNFAKPLSEADIANLAAYYASLSACPE